MKIKTSDGVELAIQDWGAGETVVLLTPWACTAEVWQYTMADLEAQGRRCISFDRRGHGRSDIARDYSFSRLVQDVAEVLDALEIRDATLVGYSLGGAEAMGHVARDPKRISRLVLVAAAAPCVASRPGYAEGIDPALADMVRGLWTSDFASWVKDSEEAFFRLPHHDIARGTVDWLSRMLLATPLQVALATNRAMFEVDLRDAMRACPLPALVVHGDADASIPVAFGRASAKLLPNARYVELPGAPHGLPFTHRRELLEEVMSFMRSSG